MTDDTQDKTHPPPQLAVPEGSIRETLESIVIAFVLAFVFRAFVVEAFVIPTGSMAPTLLGAHVQTTCPQCGYRFTSGPRDYADSNTPHPIQGIRGTLTLPCPMCRFPIHEDAMATNAGDRILVLKYLYAFSEPKRWDVVVFKNPEQPAINYIKRLVGLPSEQLWIVDGNIYTRPLTAGGEPQPTKVPWQIQRKPEKVQRAVWQPVYHSDYYPLDGGEVVPGELTRENTWNNPWRPTGVSSAQWEFSEVGPVWTYHDDEAEPGTLSFQFDPVTAVNYYYYNTLTREGPRGDRLIEDLRLAATVTPDGPGLRTGLYLSAGQLNMRALIEPDGQVILQTRPRDDDAALRDETGWTTQQRGSIGSPPADRPMRVELWHVDQALSAWVNGEMIAEWQYDDVDIPQLAAANRPNRPPQVALTVQGPAVRVRSVDLDRDLYYTQQGRGALATRDEPATIAEDRFFCLGDNSPQSKDSRLWEQVDQWVHYNVATGPEQQQPHRLIGYVPRDLMIGKAFFVYFPAPHRLSEKTIGFIPNFGQMRFIH